MPTDWRCSVTYQAILREGAIEQARRMLLISGRERFGPPDMATASALNEIAEIESLEKLTTKLLKVQSWNELLDAN